MARKRPSVFARLRQDLADASPFPKRRFAEVLGSRMAYVEEGSGPPVVFIHGGIGSSVLWRRQISLLAPYARCIAVDLIGTGDSERLLPSSRDSYRLESHLAYLESFTTVLGIDQPMVLVLHGWGSMTGFAYAQQHSHRIRGLCHMESIIRPLEWEDLGPKPREMFERARGADGERFVMDTDEYFDLAVRRELLNPPGKVVTDEFRRTLGRPAEMRQALHTALHTVPIAGSPTASFERVQSYARWLGASSVPKLLVLGQPGYWIVDRLAAEAMALPNTTTVQVSGGHLLPEDAPDGVALMIAQWVRSL
ncbi:MAG TPA: alpha/beta fold hydrolase [Acidimicrobiia bacterium]|nr:alpha/beta fold hydrolase [Acidimicrobiia bacterium]